MDLAKFLDADLQTIARLIGRGLSWWRDELLGMVPERWHRRSDNGAQVIVRPDGEEFRVEHVAEGVVGTLDIANGKNWPKAVLCLPNDAGLTRMLDLPLLSSSDLRQAIALDMDRLTPFEPHHVLFDVIIQNREPGRQTVVLGVLPRNAALAVLERARANGLSPASLALADEAGRPCFDFLSAMEAGENLRSPWTRGRLWAVAASLLALNLSVFIARDMMALADLRQQVEARQPMVQAAEKLRAVTDAEAVRRKDFIRRKQMSSPLPILDGLTRSLPDDVWIQRLEWNGTTLRIGGWVRGETEVLGLIEADPALANARSDAPAAMGTPSRGKPFDITVEREKGDKP